MTTLRRAGVTLAALALALLSLGVFAGASWADSPVSVKAVGRIHIVGDQATLTIIHGDTGSPNVLTMHVNLRPDSSPGGGPNTKNTKFTVTKDQPSPETFSVDLPQTLPGWCYVQADAWWTGGRATSPRVPVPGGCVTPSPSPSPSVTPTPSDTPSVSHRPSVTPRTTPVAHVATLPKTGSDASRVLLTSVAALLGGGVLVALARRPHRH